MARGRTKIAWSCNIASSIGISVLDDGGTVEWAAVGVLAEDFGVPSLAMAGGWWDATGFGWR